MLRGDIMVITLIHIFAVFFMLLGIASLIKGVHYYLNSVSNSGRYIFVILDGDDADIKLRSAVEYFMLYEADAFEGIIAVDYGLSEELKTACRIVADESNAVEFYSKKGFLNFFGGECSEQGE